ncbi:hypothetical protein [Sphingomonas lenta]|uniref:Uncharacterized protein n=1 Tax=Sphingomonas lenta TaxID=1141887 RepID=A0A2A2SIW5_9SPHN|nr:hypothetical protein [Sphingomonas lenta]PAX09100.1 hypothetical protein CKY28_07195 [Sphingomonas lenta]
MQTRIGAIWDEPVRVDCAQRSWLRDRVTANALRELDRFLNLLIDVAAEHAGLRTWGGRRRTPNKLSALQSALGSPRLHHEALRSIGRVRDCLFHCGGLVRRPDHRQSDVLTLMWRAGSTRRRATLAIGDRIDLTAADVLAICELYRRIAAELVTHSASVEAA